MIHDAALTRRQKLHAYSAALRYYLAELRRVRIRPLRARLIEKLRALGVPMDRILPFH